MPDDTIALNLARIVHRLLTNPRGWEVSDLKSTLGIADRTFRKYAALLRGFEPFSSKGESIVRDVRDGDRRYLRLGSLEAIEIDTSAELVARIAAHQLALTLFGFLGDTDVTKALRDGYAELRSRFKDPHYARYLFANVDRMILGVPDAPKDYAKHEKTIREVLKAFVWRRRVRIRYAAAKGEDEHTLEPLTLALYRSGLYVLARYVDQPKIYNFAIDRIGGIELLAEHFDYPTKKEYDPAKILAEGFGIFLPPAPGDHRVELIFADVPWLKRYVRERRWSPTQRFEDLRDGRLRMRFRVSSLVEVKSWIFGIGDKVEVVKPSREALMNADREVAGATSETDGRHAGRRRQRARRKR